MRDDLEGGLVSFAANDKSVVSIYLAEEQELFRQAIVTRLESVDPAMQIVGVTDQSVSFEGNFDAILSDFGRAPDVLVVGTTRFNEGLLATLTKSRAAYPAIGTLVICNQHDLQSCHLVREYLGKAKNGAAYLMRASIDSLASFIQVVRSVNDGHLVIDPGVYSALGEDCNAASVVLKSLDAEEIKVLNWISRGYTESAVGQILSMDRMTVEKHMLGIFQKLKPFIPASKEPRIAAILAFHRATGSLLDESERRWPEFGLEYTFPEAKELYGQASRS